MKKSYLTIIIVLTFSLLILTTGCTSTKSKDSDVHELKIAAASDLALAFNDIGKLFEEETNSKITFSFGSTGQLADQIENGAPFDVFAAANIKFVDQLREKDLILPETQTTYAFGRIGLSTLIDSSLSIKNLEDLLKPEVKKIAIANPEHAPYGLAAKQALKKAGLWEELESKLVYGRNISDTLTFIETGNVEAGIIALSLYKEEEFTFHIIDDHMHAPLEQSIAVIRPTNQEELAKQFITFIKGPIGKPIMESYGFIVPEGK
ncbi:molybdate ABC transporter substrate-binding protein [Bacillus sp. MRMR6]|uniref:molybdate ABC transporter substrate-binding protein n=1 Tax=Bacillus sp. MRMR6 TaxID=1928617 RepID=UPI000952F2B4|nr:molybdate ABC transporter substrate-binding protein [Bacillus sp. MRMR6]OLS41328.1 molybdate ABC transporter substrate-binding protein [Bacillus sp. MRMR6]